MKIRRKGKMKISEGGEKRIAQLLEKGIKPTVCPAEVKRCLVPCWPDDCTCLAFIWGKYTIVSPETAERVLEDTITESYRLTEELNKDRHTNDTV